MHINVDKCKKGGSVKSSFLWNWICSVKNKKPNMGTTYVLALHLVLHRSRIVAISYKDRID